MGPTCYGSFAATDKRLARKGTPTPNPSPQGGGGLARVSASATSHAISLGIYAEKSPSPLWGGVRGGGKFNTPTSRICTGTR
jgi:2-oxoisovalerate dehydrogenase E2 component (dihydrolipoyl transacylase)